VRTITKLASVERLRRTAEGDQALERYIKTEVESYISGLAPLYMRWQEYLRMYRGIPNERFSRDPIPIMNIEVTLGAIATDTLTAQAADMLEGVQPLVTVRGSAGHEDTAAAFQTLVNHLAIDPFTNFVEARKDFLLDWGILGTGLFYTTWQEEVKQTGVEEIVDWGPRIYAPAPEDLVLPSGSGPDIQVTRMVGFSRIMTHGVLELRGRAEGWDVDLAAPTRAMNPVRRQRQVAAHVADKEPADNDFFDIYELFIYYPYDGKGYDIDLYCVWDRTASRILFLSYNPFDSRPFSVGRYQFVSHSFFGLGIMEMAAPFEREVTDWHNFRMANAKLVNSRAWGVKIGSPMCGSKLRIIPNKPLYFQSPDDLKEFRMADIYPSALQTEQYSMQLADRRIGTLTDFSSRPMPGHRTPGITTLSILQQINKRFTLAFSELRAAYGDALMQSVLRIQEQFKTNADNRVRIAEWLSKVLGASDSEKVLLALRGPAQDLRDKLTVEMTASSQSVNREADKQGALQVSQALMVYYDKVLQYAAAAGSPQMTPQMKQLMVKAVKAATEAMDQLLRTFDRVRDTHAYLLTEEDFDALLAQERPGGGLLGGPGGGTPGMAEGVGAGGQAAGSAESPGGDSGAGMAGPEDAGIA